MRKAFFSIVVIAIGCMLAPTANGSILSDFLTFDGPVHNPAGPPNQGGGEDKLRDDSLSRHFDTNNNGLFDQGETILAMITLSEVDASGQLSVGIGANSQIAIVAGFTIGTAGTGGSLNLLPNMTLLQTYLHSSISSLASLNANSAAVVLSTSTPDTNPSDDPVNWNINQLSNINTGFSTTNNWGFEMTLGITNNGQDFSEFSGTAGVGGLQRGGFTIQSIGFGGAPIWLPVDVFDFGNNKHFVDVSLDFASVNLASDDEVANGWTFNDQGSYFINGVPEPGSFVIWGMLVGLGGVIAGRRRHG